MQVSQIFRLWGVLLLIEFCSTQFCGSGCASCYGSQCTSCMSGYVLDNGSCSYSTAVATYQIIIGVVGAIVAVIVIGCVIRSCCKRCRNTNTDPLADANMRRISTQTVTGYNPYQANPQPMQQSATNLGSVNAKI